MKRILKIEIMILIILLFLSYLGCIYAEDINGSDDKLNSNLEDSQNLEITNTGNNNENNIINKPANTTNPQAYLILDNDANIENVYIGDHITWIISVINIGPDTAKNVKVLDQLPDGLKYIKHTTTKGTFNPKTGIWNIGNLSVSDGKVFLKIITLALTAGEKINKVNLTTDTYNLNYNESYEEEEIDVFELENLVPVKKSIESIYSAGNPIALILLSLFTMFMIFIKTDK